MKKIIYCALALAAGLFAASCQQENLEPVAQGGNTVTFTVETPAALQTKAIADGMNVDELIYEVWLTPTLGDLSKGAQKLYRNVKPMNPDVQKQVNSTVITLDLVNDQKYTVLLWAQKNGTGVYDTDELNDVHYNSTKAGAYAANDERLAAFYGVAYVNDGKTVTKEGAEAPARVELRRPFAQVNLGTLNTSTEQGSTTGYTIDIKESNMILRNVPTHFNVVNGMATEPAEMEFLMYNAPCMDKAITDEDATLPGFDNPKYWYAGMNYVFASNAETGITAELEYNIVTKLNDGNVVTVNNVIPNVPLKENYRTNIIGNLLTSSTDYEVVIDASFNDPAKVVSVWDGSSATEPTTETDKETGKPTYVIDEASDLAYFAQFVNGTLPTRSTTIEAYNFKLKADIDLGNHPWTPIGTSENIFCGTFNGNGHTIKNLNIVVTEAKEGKAYLGFFGYAKDATIKDVTFENVNLNVACLDIDHSQGHIGAVAGSLEGTSTIENVTVKGNIFVEATTTANGASRVAVVAGGNASGDVTMKNVHVIANEGSYLKANNNLGALAGQLQGKSVFENCSSNIDVTGTKFFAGGIIGIAAGDQTFTNCHTTGNVTITAGREGRNHDQYRVGGIAGGWADGATKVCTLVNCSYKGNISGTNSDGSIANPLDYAGYVGRGYTLNNCQGSKVVINGVEYVQAYNTAAEAGIYYVNGVYTIASAANLKIFAAKVNAGETFEGETVVLANDIDLKNEQWMPIGYWQTFNGTFDGQNHTISNLKHHGTEEDCYIGLFGYTENATIKNLTINNVDLKLVANDSWAGGHMGALVGNIEGTTVIENINVTGTVRIDGDLEKIGAGRIGGVVGGNTCTASFKNVVVKANVGSFVKGNSSIGGIAGQLQGVISFENCSSNIDVSAQWFAAGGIIGLTAENTTFTNCTTSGNISVLAGRADNAHDAYRVGGIAGSWDDGADNVITLSNCSTTCVLAGQSADGKAASGFDCAGYVGRGYSAVVGSKVIVNGSEYVYAGDGKYADAEGYLLIAPGLGYKDNTYAVSSAAGLVALSNTTIKGKESVILTADIDLTGVEFNGLSAFNPETPNTFNGNGKKVSNWTYTGGASDMGFIKSWTGTIKDVTIENASLKTAGRSAVLAGKVYANIDNCHVVNSTIEDSYWACGVIAGLYNSGSITKCSVDGCSVKSNGGTGAIVGVINEAGGDRKVENCTVKNTTVNNTGAYGEAYSGALVAGMFNADGATYIFNNCTLENNTKQGNYVGDLFYATNGETVIVDGVQQ